jgi:hypothetical protein
VWREPRPCTRASLGRTSRWKVAPRLGKLPCKLGQQSEESHREEFAWPCRGVVSRHGVIAHARAEQFAACNRVAQVDGEQPSLRQQRTTEFGEEEKSLTQLYRLAPVAGPGA